MSVEFEEEVAGETTLQYFEFGQQYPFQPLAVNITYCIFNIFKVCNVVIHLVASILYRFKEDV